MCTKPLKFFQPLKVHANGIIKKKAGTLYYWMRKVNYFCATPKETTVHG